jgi:hypothetical protein
MHEIWIERRRFTRFLSFALMLSVAAGLLGRSARAQAPVPASSAPPAATAAPAPPSATSPTATPSMPTVAAPPSPPTKEQLAEAKKFFEAGLKLKKEGLYQEALASFLEANRISPRESIQNNLALTYRLLKDMASAYEAYDALLSKYGDKMKPALKDQAQRALEELGVLTGVIAVEIQEPGAKVTIDGKDLGQTPLAKPVRLNIGTHQVSITKDGFDPIAQPVEIRGHDSVPLSGPLVKTVLTGHLSVEVKQTNPPDPTVRIFVDTNDAGAPPYQVDLDPGMHTIEARGEKAVSPAKQIQVEKRGTYTETLDLHVQMGTVAVNVDVAESEIALDGTLVARGVYEGQVPAGTHSLTVTKLGYAQYKKDILVHDGERLVENVPLQKEAQSLLAPPHDWKGVYSHLDFVGLFAVTKPTNDIAQGVGYTPDTPINTSAVAGGGLDIRVGYSLGFLGIEGTVLMGYDHSASTAVVPPNESTVTHPGAGGPGPDGNPSPTVARTENYDFNRLGGTIAAGVRLMPKTQIVRPTLGVGAGVSLKTIFYKRNIGSQSSENTNPAFYVAPAIMADAGIELGSTPGTRFYLGCQLVADFASATPVTSDFKDPNYPAPTPAINGVNGTDLFIGPILGMQFGE